MFSTWVSDWFTNAMDRSLNRLADALFSIAEQFATRAFAGGDKGGGDFWSQIGGAIGNYFNGGSVNKGGGPLAPGNVAGSTGMKGRAGGGPVYRGDLRPINERGLEYLSSTSDGFVHRMGSSAVWNTERGGSPAGNDSGRSSPIRVELNNGSGTPMRAEATETTAPNGDRTLIVGLERLVDSRVERRFAEQRSGRDDSMFSGRFGLRPRLSGA